MFDKVTRRHSVKRIWAKGESAFKVRHDGEFNIWIPFEVTKQHVGADYVYTSSSINAPLSGSGVEDQRPFFDRTPDRVSVDLFDGVSAKDCFFYSPDDISTPAEKGRHEPVTMRRHRRRGGFGRLGYGSDRRKAQIKALDVTVASAERALLSLLTRSKRPLQLEEILRVLRFLPKYESDSWLESRRSKERYETRC